MVRIAPEGVRVILTIAGVALVLGIATAIAGHPWLLVLVLAPVVVAVWFFRDPDRMPPPDPRLLVSPADGHVVDVRTVAEHELLGAPAQRVSIFMSPLDVHVNRAPVEGVIESIRHTRGRFHAAFADKSSDENERTAMVLQGDGRRYLVVQIAGAVARRIVCRRHEGDRLERGERYGMIMFGSRVDVYLPPDVSVRATKGMRVRAGTTPIAELRP
jgi:phosphatidylserine decarboxylase